MTTEEEKKPQPIATDNSAKLLAESQPQGNVFVGAMDKAKIRNAVDPVAKINAIADPQDILFNAKETAINEYNVGKAERDKQAKEDAEAKAQAEKEANEEKWAKRWAAIGDGISSIANLVAVGHGAPNMYDPSNSLHSKIKGEYDRIHALKAADAQARRKEQMDLLLKQYELDARAAEAEANRNLSMWRTETEEAGRNQRAKDKQESDQKIADQRNETTLKAATIRGRSGGGGGSSSNGKYYYNGVAYKSESERNQKILRDAKKYGVDTKDEYGDKRDWDDLAVELEDLIAQGEPDTQPVAGNFVTRWGNMFGGNSTSVPKSTSSKASTPTKKDNAAVTP